MPISGDKIKALRRERKLTLDDLATRVGISKSYVWELENRPQANPSAEILDKVAAQLGVPLTYFLEEESTKPREQYLDEAFFRNYQRLEAPEKEQLRRILETFRKPK
jgi:transcriptional regulator with XRE-family HTH domain